MDEFTISLAGIPIGIKPLCPRIKAYFADYLSSEKPHFTVAASKEDLEYERVVTDRLYGNAPSLEPLVAYNMETLAILRKIANRLPEYDTLLFHGSALAVDGKAYIFTAPSGTGKTTHTRLWLQQLPQAYILNGDKPFLKADGNGRILVCGTPWRGKERLGCNETLPLAALCFLERAKENSIRSITPKEANEALLHQAHIAGGTGALRTIQLLNRISTEIPLFRLGCNMDPEAAQVSSRAMLSAGAGTIAAAT